MTGIESKKWRLLFWALHTAGWVGFSGAMIFLVYTDEMKNDPPFFVALIAYALGYFVCLPLRAFYKKIKLHERPLRFSILIGLASTFIAANLWLGLDILLSRIGPFSGVGMEQFWRHYLASLLSMSIPILGWTSLYFGVKVWREWKEQGERARRADDLAQAAQLQMLRHQVNPHFLFNAMNSIRALIDEDEEKAREMITELSEFLRYSLVSKDYADVPLREELEAIRHYFAVQRKRYEDKLDVRFDVEPRAADFPVLSFLIHPLAENAVKYGMRTGPIPLVVRLAARLEGDALTLEVSNTGTWVAASPRAGADFGDTAAQGTGTGLDNVRRRLENAFPGRHRLDIFERDGSVHVRLTVRGRTAGRPA